MARPKIEIDEALVRKLATIHCTMNEISAVVGCSVDTLERRYAELIKKGKNEGKSSLRRLQWEAAQKGNTTMLIWLGKQILAQRDVIEEPRQQTEDLSPGKQNSPYVFLEAKNKSDG